MGVDRVIGDRVALYTRQVVRERGEWRLAHGSSRKREDLPKDISKRRGECTVN